ncbi:MAG: hypothetical protein C0524_07900 [Rhodobacter sp.]|nr:hypothetical protein [Rhodobacter sp.]
MPSALEEMRARMAELQQRLEDDMSAARDRFSYRLERERAVFDVEVVARHRAARVRFWEFLRHTRPLVVLTAPFIYVLILPFVLLDLMVSLYQAVCFPVYGIARVRRRDHIVIDRHLLHYLNWLQKLNCLYCSYVNGLISYIREIAARTEQYWCPIKHSRRAAGLHERHADFIDYGDAKGWRTELEALRDKLGPPRA